MSTPHALPSVAVDPLCRHPTPTTPPPASPTELPMVLADVAKQVETIRELRFERPVSPEPVTSQQIGGLLRAGFDQAFPPEMEARRQKAWATIGVIPKGTDLYQAWKDIGGTQVVGFYDTISHQLVFIGSNNPTPYQRYTLSHELTHALDDQLYNLGRLDVLQNTCQDEPLEALSSLAEGDAVETQTRWAGRFLSPDEVQQLTREAGQFSPPPPTIPAFVLNLFLFPYPNGQRFVEALLAKGGQAAVDGAFLNPPVSTEQILHPEKYPSDVPVAVTVPDLGSKLPAGWTTIDVDDVGEGWLRTMLALRMTETEAQEGADGWDGGQYRAWSAGDRTIVAMATAWDTVQQAQGFDETVRRWLGDQPATVTLRGSTVTVLFGSDPTLLPLLNQLSG